MASRTGTVVGEDATDASEEERRQHGVEEPRRLRPRGHRVDALDGYPSAGVAANLSGWERCNQRNNTVHRDELAEPHEADWAVG